MRSKTCKTLVCILERGQDTSFKVLKKCLKMVIFWTQNHDSRVILWSENISKERVFFPILLEPRSP